MRRRVANIGWGNTNILISDRPSPNNGTSFEGILERQATERLAGQEKPPLKATEDGTLWHRQQSGSAESKRQIAPPQTVTEMDNAWRLVATERTVLQQSCFSGTERDQMTWGGVLQHIPTPATATLQLHKTASRHRELTLAELSC